MNLPFLDSALAACGRRFTITTLATKTRVLFQRCIAVAQRYTVCCAPSRKGTRGRDADLLGSFVRYCGRKHAGFTGLPLPAGGRMSVRRQNIYRELQDELPVLTLRRSIATFAARG